LSAAGTPFTRTLLEGTAAGKIRSWPEAHPDFLVFHRFREPEQRWRRAHHAIVMPVRNRYRSSSGWPGFCGTVFTNGRDSEMSPFLFPSPLCQHRAGVVRITLLRCEAQLLDRRKLSEPPPGCVPDPGRGSAKFSRSDRCS
jgi:hypothetical protein